MLALLLGAGFSKWASNLPLAYNLFDFEIKPWGSREESRLAAVAALKRAWDGEHPAGLAEQFIADAVGFDERKRRLVLWYVVRRLSEPFIYVDEHPFRSRRHTLMIDEYRKYRICGVSKAQAFLQMLLLEPLSGIVTTNYDMLVEYALGTKLFSYGVPNQRLTGRGAYPVSQWLKPVTLTGSTLIAKIHGSVSWDAMGHYTDGRRGLTGEALIVAPTPEKQAPEALEGAWALAGTVLSRADRLLVFGFAFNPYDESVLNLLKNAGEKIRAVLLIDPVSRVEAAAAVWPNASIAHVPPPPESDRKIREWLGSCQRT